MVGLEQGIAIGIGLTNPESQYQAYTQYALDNKLITQADANTLSPLVSQCQQAIKSCGNSQFHSSLVMLHILPLHPQPRNRKTKLKKRQEILKKGFMNLRSVVIS